MPLVGSCTALHVKVIWLLLPVTAARRLAGAAGGVVSMLPPQGARYVPGIGKILLARIVPVAIAVGVLDMV